MAGYNLRATVDIPAGAGAFDLYPAYGRLAATRTAEVLKLVQERRKLMLDFWVKNETHPRLQGMHQNSGATQGAIDSLEARIRQAAAPINLKLKMVRPKP